MATWREMCNVDPDAHAAHELPACVHRLHRPRVVAGRGYFGVGVYHAKHEVNIGTLWRSAYQMGAAFVFTIGKRYERQAADTTKAWRHLPMMHYQDYDDFLAHLPLACPVVGIEMGGRSLSGFTHFERCAYLLGAEDHGLPADVLSRCHYIVSLDAVRTPSYNVAVAGSIVMYDRMSKLGNGDGCRECDQTGQIDRLLSPAEARKALGVEVSHA